MSCEYCEAQGFKAFGVQVVGGSIQLFVPIGSIQLSTLPSFRFCPMCGEPLSDPQALTLEELRERDGKPVFAVGTEGENVAWEIVNMQEMLLNEYDLKQGVKYYDRPPKEDA